MTSGHAAERSGEEPATAGSAGLRDGEPVSGDPPGAGQAAEHDDPTSAHRAGTAAGDDVSRDAGDDTETDSDSDSDSDSDTVDPSAPESAARPRPSRRRPGVRYRPV